jgi:hypothetical protein
MKTRVLGFPAVAVLSLVAGCNEGRGAPERAGVAAAAVIQGTFDQTFKYMYVGQLTSSTGEGCSAELVTPNWILTANHCITGTTNVPITGGITASYDVSFDVLGFTQGTPPQSTHFTHTFNPAFPKDPGVIVLNPGPIDASNNENTASDLALIRLDQPVPTNVVPLAPIAGFSAPPGSQPCTSISENGGYATEVGFGPTAGSFCNSQTICASDSSPGRNYATAGGWSYATASAGEQYLQNTWSTSDYYGIAHGDSGGALVWGNQVCGINSAMIWSGAFGYNQEPELDSPNNAAFLAQNLRNTDGTLQGTCNVTNPGFLGIGNEAGGTVVEIDGAGFDQNFPPQVVFGGVPASAVTCSSTSKCLATAPAGSSGTVPVTVSMWNASPSMNPNGGAPVACSGNNLTFQYGPTAPSCSAAWSCQSDYTGATTISCFDGVTGLSLGRATSGGPLTEVINPNTTQTIGAFMDYYEPPAGTSIAYQVEATDATGSTFSAPMDVVTTDCSCHTAVECPSNGCGTMPDGCGGILNCGTCTSGICSSNNTCIIPPTCAKGYVYCVPAGGCETPFACSKIGSGGSGCTPALAKAGGC